ncbi:MAG: serine dehydratase subunit alpha family protein [Erysipelotrichia bacterium]|nr:serine dehydratase subunit alpha family protein [Erysipelotrichia bacterium]NCC54427.1 serine dehydratase subunit alpha family protein [Erysipelotrichia bacterium]
MNKEDQRYTQYINILKEELIPAMGCTEPIAIAYLSSYAKEVLGEEVKEVCIEVSGNVLKNVKSVIVPNTEKMKGIQAACAAGIVCGQASKKLEVIAEVDEVSKKKIKQYIETHDIKVTIADSPYIFDLFITLKSETQYVKVRIVNYHTNIVYVEKNGEILIENDICEIKEDVCDKSCLNVESIVAFASSVAIEDVKAVLDRQINYNMAIAEEGIKHDYGANIGSVLLKTYPNDVNIKAKAMAAAASDARMNGCELPVIIVSGSGNQGITASVPLITYAKSLAYSQEDLYRALVVSNLVTIHQKSGIGRLSAFCGAVSAGVGSGAGIAYLETKDFKTVAHTIVNALGIVSGMVCDGAKASCAAKIQAAVDAGILGYHMYLEHQEFKDGDGLIVKGVENTIQNISTLAREGMKQTDQEIIRMMVKGC